MDWYRSMVKQIWQNFAENTHPFSHGEMVRWWNELKQIYGEMNMVKWCTEYTHMFTWWNWYQVKWCGENNTKVKWCNGKQLYSPSTAVSTAVGFLVPSKDGGLSWFFNSSDAVSPAEEKIVSEWCRADCLNGPWATATPFDAAPPWFFCSIAPFHSTFNSSHHNQHHVVLPPSHLPVSCHFSLYLYWRYITICQALL